MDAPLEEEDEEFDDTGDINNAVLLLPPTELVLAEVGVVTLLIVPPLGTMAEFWSSDLLGLLGEGGTCVVCVGVGGTGGGFGCSGGCTCRKEGERMKG